MKIYKEKRKSNIEVRTCIHCGEQWQVRVRGNKKSNSGRCFCDNCLKTLTKYEKQHIWRIHTGRYHEETRQCLNCGKTWTVEVKNDAKQSKIKYFCSDCNEELTQKDKANICRLKIEGFHEKEKEARRLSHKRNIIHNMVSNAKERATKKGLEFNLEDNDIYAIELSEIDKLNEELRIEEDMNFEFIGKQPEAQTADVEVKDIGAVNPVYADAVRQMRKADEKRDEYTELPKAEEREEAPKFKGSQEQKKMQKNSAMNSIFRYALTAMKKWLSQTKLMRHILRCPTPVTLNAPAL